MLLTKNFLFAELTVGDTNCRCATVCWCNCVASIINQYWLSKSCLQCVVVEFSQMPSRTVSTIRWAWSSLLKSVCVCWKHSCAWI